MNRREFTSGLVSTALLSMGPPAFAAERKKSSATSVLFENGATVQNRAHALETASYVLGELVKRRHRRETRDDVIRIVTTANPTAITWYGTPRQLFEQGREVLDRIAFRDSCSDLVRAWDQVALSVQLTTPSTLEVIAIGPLVHAGYPCHESPVIQLPQAVPQDLKLAQVARIASRLLVLNVHPDQRGVYAAYLEQHGILERARAGKLDLALMGEPETKNRLGRLLEGGQ